MIVWWLFFRCKYFFNCVKSWWVEWFFCVVSRCCVRLCLVVGKWCESSGEFFDRLILCLIFVYSFVFCCCVSEVIFVIKFFSEVCCWLDKGWLFVLDGRLFFWSGGCSGGGLEIGCIIMYFYIWNFCKYVWLWDYGIFVWLIFVLYR